MRHATDFLTPPGVKSPAHDVTDDAAQDATRATECAEALAAYFEQVAATGAHQYEFFPLLRSIEALAAHLPRLGSATHPADEPIRLAQEPSLAFAPGSCATLSWTNAADGQPVARLSQFFFGFLGPNGPLPLHLTEFARERVLHHDDLAFTGLLDTLLHRFLLLFYRAWAQGQPVNSLDRRDDDRFAFYLGSLIGLADASCRNRDTLSDHARLHFCGMLGMQTRPAIVLENMATAVLRMPVKLEPFCGHWMKLPGSERTALASRAAASASGARAPLTGLGTGAVLGGRVWDRQHKFRLVIGPLTLAQYESLLPGGSALTVLASLVRQHLNREFDWDALLVLRAADVPALQLGRNGRLGHASWLACASREHDAASLALDADAWASAT